MTTITRVRIRWAARRDGISHGHTPVGIRTLCGLPEIRDRDGWPAHRKCLGCVEIAKDLGWKG
jgi:hypothetical protein